METVSVVIVAIMSTIAVKHLTNLFGAISFTLMEANSASPDNIIHHFPSREIITAGEPATLVHLNCVLIKCISNDLCSQHIG